MPSGTRIADYVLDQVLHATELTVVYLAHDLQHGAQVVIKESFPVVVAERAEDGRSIVPRADLPHAAALYRLSLENFSRKASIQSTLCHPGIVRVVSSFDANGTSYLVLPYTGAVPLALYARNRASHPLGPSELTHFLRRMLEVLTYCHERGIIHRHLSPQTILLTSQRHPLIGSFGAAYAPRELLTVDCYMSPELIHSPAAVGPWSDFYSLAAVMTKLITGDDVPCANDRTENAHRLPFADGRMAMDGLHPAFLSSIERALRMNPAERWQDAADWLAALG